MKASYHSINGEIVSSWKKEGRQINLNVTVPVNTTANVFIPTIDHEKVLESGKAVKAHPDFKIIGFGNGYLNIKVGSGNYHFTSQIQ